MFGGVFGNYGMIFIIKILLDDGVEPISKKMSMVMEFPNIPILKYR
jgi:hypothetical protein